MGIWRFNGVYLKGFFSWSFKDEKINRNISRSADHSSKHSGRYGNFANVAKTTKRIERAIHGKSMRDYQEVALQMIASKLARIANGDPDYIDNWVDIAGYAQLVANELEAERLHKGGEQ